MLDRTQAKNLITEFLIDEALLLGGLVAVYQVDDEFIWRFMKGIDHLQISLMKKIDHAEFKNEQAPNIISPDPHPAIDEFLHRLKTN